MNGRILERFFGPIVLAALAVTLAVGLQAQLNHATVVEGAGATFPAPMYARWIALFERDHEVAIEYESIGSGGGIDAILAEEVAFGASDALLTDDERAELDRELLEVPSVLGAVAVAYNLPGLGGDLVLDAATVSGIYLGDVTRWDDPAIAALNPGLDLPDLAIRVTRRADSSGTTAIFTDYLSAVSEEWAAEVGVSKTPDWPVSGAEGDGNDGVAQQILVRRGGIGYVEYSYARNAGLAVAGLVNRAGEVVYPDQDGVQAAERNTPAEADSILKPSLVDAPGAESYPIAGFTYLLVFREPTHLDHAEAEGLVAFLEWALTEGQDEAGELGYSALPDELAAQARALVATIDVDAAAAEH